MKSCCEPNCERPVFTHGYCSVHKGLYYSPRAKAKGIKTALAKIGKGELPKLKKELWKIFSEFIRLRDSEGDFFICISCGKTKPIYFIGEEDKKRKSNLHAGHYHKSEMSAALRYDEKNVNGQCYSCNMHKEGNRQGYEQGLIKKYGADVIQLLDIRKNNKIKWGRFEYETLITEYKLKVEQLKIQKGIK